MSGEPANERAFREWVEQEGHRREIERLVQRMARLEWLQLAGYVLILGWTVAMFVGFQLWPERIPADVAGFVTLWAWLAGGIVIWRIIQLKRVTTARLDRARAALEMRGEDTA